MPTALVTGASSGIGAELALELARRHYDLVLVARRRDHLEKVAASCADRFGVEVQVCPADLTQPGASTALVDALTATEIEVLVNNAGVGELQDLARSAPGRTPEMLLLNVVALTQLTRFLLEPMVKRRRGRILNVASMAAFSPGPHFAVYYATKAYVLSFSEALASELGGSGVSVTCLCPGLTKTEFMTNANSNTARPTPGHYMPPEQVAKCGVEALLAGRPIAIPGATNQLAALLSRALPRRTSTALVDKFLRLSLPPL